MTATRDRQSDLDSDPAHPAWDERSIVGNTRGLPWWAAVLLAFGLAAAAAAFDMQRQDALGRIYQVAYVVGCLAAVCWVRRRNLFGPMVQPPLIFAVTAIGAVVATQPGALDSGVKGLIFSVALPLTSNFPTMAITTGVTVLIGFLRFWRQRDPLPRVRSNRSSARDREPLLDDPGAHPARAEAGSRGIGPPRDRGAADRAGERGRGRPDQRSGRRPERERSGGRDQPPPRKGRGRGEPERDRSRSDRGRANPGSDPGRRRQPGMRGDQPPRRSPDPNQPRRRRPPEGNF